ncbi:MAG: lycopene cyclase domain-containing protein [Candidatus Thermoplasmatota archaeon]|nr:lycopene cyclase domain-containing protein [Candidatus Thermoplasmatota archaeon]
MNYLYLLINFLVILFPFLLSFDKKVAFYKKWKALPFAYIAVGIPFVLWDMIMTKEGHWGFSEDYILGIHILSIPLEEALFFVTVPYACIFTYECIVAYIPSKRIPFHPAPYILLGLLSFVLAAVFWDQAYTMSAFVSLGIVLIGAPLLSKNMLSTSSFLIFIAITMGLFIAVNYILTSIPIVWYWHEAIWGDDGAWQGRFITIPYEDFIYNIAMLTGYLAVYHRFRDRWGL